MTPGVQRAGSDRLSEEDMEWQSDRESFMSYSNSLQYSRVSELSPHGCTVKHARCLQVVGFNAADEVGLASF